MSAVLLIAIMLFLAPVALGVRIEWRILSLTVLVGSGIQILAAALADRAEGRRLEGRAVALASFGFAIAGLSTVADAALEAWTSSPDEVAAGAQKTLFGAFVCHYGADACRVVVGTTATSIAAVCLFVLWLASESLGARSQVQPRMLFMLAAWLLLWNFTALEEWPGAVVPISKLQQREAWSDASVTVLSLIGWTALSFFLAAGSQIGFTFRLPHLPLPPPSLEELIGALRRVSVFVAVTAGFLLLISGAVVAVAVAVLFVLDVPLEAIWNLFDRAARWAASQRADPAQVPPAPDLAPLPSFSIRLNVWWALGLVALGAIIWRPGRAISLLRKLGGLAHSDVRNWLERLIGGPPLAPVALLGVNVGIFAFYVSALAFCVWLAAAPRSADQTPPLPCLVACPPEKPFQRLPRSRTFQEVKVQCESAGGIRSAEWSYGSSRSFAFTPDACSLSAERQPEYLIVVGTASEDDQRADGFTLSVERGERLARLAREQYPRIPIIVAALGKERSNDQTELGNPDRYPHGRRARALASYEEFRAPAQRSLISTDVTEALRASGLLDRYEACVLIRPGGEGGPPLFPFGVRPPLACKWVQ